MTSIPNVNLLQEDNTFLYNILSTCNWSGIYDSISVVAAVDGLNAIVRDSMEEEITLC
jgi:hypothetical protein